MKKMSVLDRIFLLITGVLAGYQIAVGIEGAAPLAIWAYTAGFGALLLAGVLLIIFGFELLDTPIVAIFSTLIPLALSLGLVWEYLPAWRAVYVLFVVVGFALVLFTRLALQFAPRRAPGRSATMTLAMVHGVAGLLIFGLPLFLSLTGEAPPAFALVGVGGGLIGVGGLLLSFLKVGRPILSRETILTVLPTLLLLMTSAFVAGFAVV